MQFGVGPLSRMHLLGRRPVCCPVARPICGPLVAGSRKHQCCALGEKVCPPAGNDPLGLCCPLDNTCCGPDRAGNLVCCPPDNECNRRGGCCGFKACEHNDDCPDLSSGEHTICNEDGCCVPQPACPTPTVACGTSCCADGTVCATPFPPGVAREAGTAAAATVCCPEAEHCGPVGSGYCCNRAPYAFCCDGICKPCCADAECPADENGPRQCQNNAPGDPNSRCYWCLANGEHCTIYGDGNTDGCCSRNCVPTAPETASARASRRGWCTRW